MFKITIMGSICFFATCAMLQKMFPYQATAQDIPTPQATIAPSPADIEPYDWHTLLRRIEQSGNDVTVIERFTKDQEHGTVQDLGIDYVCVTRDGFTHCFPFDAIAEVITPPGTFYKTSQGR